MTKSTPCYALDRWVTRIWQTDRRYYVGEVKQDLFGRWVLMKRWGSLYSRRGNSQTIVARDYNAATRLLEDVAKQRQARHYRPVE